MLYVEKTTEISAALILDSTSSTGDRLLSLLLTYPRFIHAELMTHRVFSRNAASSRAIPTEKMLAYAIEKPAFPIYWGKNQAGMQAREPLEGQVLDDTKTIYYKAYEAAIEHATQLMKLGDLNNRPHKQLINRILEPYIHMSTLVSSTDWENFLDLRDDGDAEPHLQHLAKAIKTCMKRSKPTYRELGEWHMPFLNSDEKKVYVGKEVEVGKMVSVARCAQLSYRTFDGSVMSESRCVELCQKLAGGKKFHASPFEHVATPFNLRSDKVKDRELWGNFTGWNQYRRILEKEGRRGLIAK